MAYLDGSGWGIERGTENGRASEALSDTIALTVATIRYPLESGGHGLGRYI